MSKFDQSVQGQNVDTQAVGGPTRAPRAKWMRRSSTVSSLTVTVGSSVKN